jgi:hypothetical protein
MAVALGSLNHAQRERLAFIDFCLQFLGQISRADLVNHFKTGLASCSRDLSLYKEIAPNNLSLRHETKQYYRSSDFSPIFDHHSQVILDRLCHGFGNSLSSGFEPSGVCIDATRLIHPKSEVIAMLMRAINNGRAVKCTYVSMTSGETEREIVPHSLANNGHRWHVRAYDRKNKDFRDFVCTRLISIRESNKSVPNTQKVSSDKQWNEIRQISLAPHPSVKHTTAIELDYATSDGKLNLNVREALLGYLMRQWNVDCSTNASLTGNEHHLWLSNVNELVGITSMAIAPGYELNNKYSY